MKNKINSSLLNQEFRYFFVVDIFELILYRQLILGDEKPWIRNPYTSVTNQNKTSSYSTTEKIFYFIPMRVYQIYQKRCTLSR